MSSALEKRDLHKLLEMLLHLNAIDDAELFRSEAMVCVDSIIPCLQLVFSEMRGDKGYGHTVAMSVYGQKAHYADRFMDGDYEMGRYFANFKLQPYACAQRDSDFMSEQERTASPVFKEIYQPEGIYYALRIRLMQSERTIGDISCFRSHEQGDFSDRELEIGSVLARHLSLKYHYLLGREPRAASASATFPVPACDKTELLTKREKQIAHAILAGGSDKQIGDELCISVGTVKRHIANIYHKLGVNNRIQLLKRLA